MKYCTILIKVLQRVGQRRNSKTTLFSVVPQRAQSWGSGRPPWRKAWILSYTSPGDWRATGTPLQPSWDPAFVLSGLILFHKLTCATKHVYVLYVWTLRSPSVFQMRWTARKSSKLFCSVYLTRKCSRGLTTLEQEAVIIRPGRSKQMLGST